MTKVFSLKEVSKKLLSILTYLVSIMTLFICLVSVILVFYYVLGGNLLKAFICCIIARVMPDINNRV